MWLVPALYFSAPEAPFGYQQLDVASRLLELGSLQMILCFCLGACVWKCCSNTSNQTLPSEESEL